MQLRSSIVLGMTVALALAILWLTLRPASPSGGPQWNDKISHALAFGALVAPSAIWRRAWLVWIAPLAVTLGAAIEIVQPLFGRDGEVADFAADLAGVALVIAVTALISARARNGRSSP
jgi:VanZ family protein